MKDEIEEFIEQHRLEFDELEPSDALWAGIEEELPEEVSQTDNRHLWWKVAAVFFLFSTIYLIYDRQVMSNRMVAQVDQSPEFSQTERYYFQQISERKQVLTELRIEEKNEDLLEEERELERIYNGLKEEYLLSQQNEEVRAALIKNLVLRMQILSDQIEVLSAIETTKDKGDDDETEI